MIDNIPDMAVTHKLFKDDIKYAYEWPKTQADYAQLLGMKNTALQKIRCFLNH